MAARIIHKVHGSIPYFQPVADTPGPARTVAATVSELRLQSTNQAALVAAAGPPGADLARIAALFDEELAICSVGDFANVLEQVTAAAVAGAHPLIGLPVLLLDVAPRFSREEDLLGDLQAMDEVGPVTLAEVFGVLSEKLRFLRSEPPSGRYGRVFVRTVEEARGRVFEVVFLPGLAEGVFPQKAAEDPILLDAWRRQLDGGLELQDDRVARERTLLRIACAAARSQLVFSYPRMDLAQARPRVPSFYALGILRAAYGWSPDLPAFEDRARCTPYGLGAGNATMAGCGS